MWDGSDGGPPTFPDDHPVDTVIHLAAPTGTSLPAPHMAVGVSATFRLLERAVASGVRRFVFASSGDALGPCDAPAREASRSYAPEGIRGAAKACGEMLVRAFGFESALSTCILRLYHPYGPGGDRFLVNRILRSVQDGTPIQIEAGDGIRLNPVWITDVARAFGSAAASAATGTFHIAGPDLVTMRELVQLAADTAQAVPVIQELARRPVQQHAADFRLARTELGFEPVVTLRQGLTRLVGCADDDLGATMASTVDAP
ncbi:MAG: UDP-glucuronate 4-epimerase [Actinomycetota bacterium]|jgi:nucleoside-diphosphate-sugar epimerase|nr:UDP-glucuronate 4-epimerase [Actinomycetota bacterium]